MSEYQFKTQAGTKSSTQEVTLQNWFEFYTSGSSDESLKLKSSQILS